MTLFYVGNTNVKETEWVLPSRSLLPGGRGRQPQHVHVRLYGLDCVLPLPSSRPSPCWSPNAQGNDIWRQSLWEVIRTRWGHGSGSFMKGSVLLWEEEETSARSLPRKDTARRWPSASQEERPHQEPNPPAPGVWTSSLQNCDKEMSVVQQPNPYYFVIVAWADLFVKHIFEATLNRHVPGFTDGKSPVLNCGGDPPFAF